MSDVNLNAGGVIGGLLGAAVAAGVIIAVGQGTYENWMTTVVIGAVVAGALGGNFLWSLVAGKPKSDDEA